LSDEAPRGIWSRSSSFATQARKLCFPGWRMGPAHDTSVRPCRRQRRRRHGRLEHRAPHAKQSFDAGVAKPELRDEGQPRQLIDPPAPGREAPASRPERGSSASRVRPMGRRDAPITRASSRAAGSDGGAMARPSCAHCTRSRASTLASRSRSFATRDEGPGRPPAPGREALASRPKRGSSASRVSRPGHAHNASALPCRRPRRRRHGLPELRALHAKQSFDAGVAKPELRDEGHHPVTLSSGIAVSRSPALHQCRSIL
jgi:hypothetical protein